MSETMFCFKDRVEAGKRLAEKLERYKDEDAVVFALPRGGVEVAAEIVKVLQAPLDLIITRKIGHPLSPEYGICAISEGGYMVCNEIERALVEKNWLDAKVEIERKEAKRRYEAYMEGREQEDVRGKTAIIVDDGVATGLNMEVAIEEVHCRRPDKIVVAVPVVPADTAQVIKISVEELVALSMPEFFLGSIGAYYDYFPQLTDEDVLKILHNIKALPKKAI